MKHILVKNNNTIFSFAPNFVITSKMDQFPGFCQNSSAQFVDVERNPIFYAGIALTNNCNLDCRHCSTNVTSRGEPRLTIGQDVMVHLIEELHQQGLSRVSITGGEPFLYPHLDSLMHSLGERYIESKINTNALAIPMDSIDSYLDCGLGEIDISLNDPFDDSATYISGHNVTPKKRAAIQEIVARFKGRLRITVSTVLTQSILNKLHDVDKLLCQLGVDKWRWRELMPSNVRNSPIPIETFAGPLDILEKVSAYLSTRPSLQLQGYFYDLFHGDVHRRCCNLENNYLFINYDLRFYWMFGLTEAYLGNYGRKTVSQLASSLTMIKETQPLPIRCHSCPAQYICVESPNFHGELKELYAKAC